MRGLSQNRNNKALAKKKYRNKLKAKWFRGDGEGSTECSSRMGNSFQDFLERHHGVNIRCRCSYCMHNKKNDHPPSIRDSEYGLV